MIVNIAHVMKVLDVNITIAEENNGVRCKLLTYNPAKQEYCFQATREKFKRVKRSDSRTESLYAYNTFDIS